MNTTSYAAGLVPARADEDAPILGELLKTARDHLVWIACVTGACVALATAYAFIARPSYESNALLRVQQASPAPGALPDVAETLLGRTSLSEAEMQLMRSRSVLAPVVAQYGLDRHADPKRLPLLGALAAALATPGKLAPAWLGLDGYGWGGEQINVAQLDVPVALEDRKFTLIADSNRRFRVELPDGSPLLSGAVGQTVSAGGVTLRIDQLVARPGTRFTLSRTNPLLAVSELANALQITELGKDTGVVRIGYQDVDPVFAAQLTNSVAASAIEQNVARHRNQANAMLDFLTRELPRLRTRVQEADRALSDFRSASGTIESTQEAQIYLQGSIELQKQMSNLALQRTQLLQRFEPTSPEVHAVDAQLGQLAASKRSFDARFDRLPAAERRSADLVRDAKVAQEIYLALVNRMQALSVERGGTVGDISMIDPAWRASVPVKPKRALIIAASLLFGLVISALSLLARRKLLARVEDAKQLERRLDLPMFGNLCFSEAQSLTHRPARLDGSAPRGTRHALLRLGAPRPAAGSLLATRYPNDRAIETMRNLRAELQFTLRASGGNVVMLTSPGPGTGKSFVASNLAALLAEAGQRVLLIDADLRRGHLARTLGVTASTAPDDEPEGLREVLAGTLAPAEAARATGVPGLFLLPAGKLPDDASALLAGPRLEQLLGRCSERFDTVIVDAPPALAISDAALISRCAVLTVLVLRAGAHREGDIADTLDKIERAGGRILGGVFNAVPERRRDREAYAHASRPAQAAA
ncbi:polysaccharide biosynthesis tyrosine autokinase [Chitinasiproducens palmae]|uniref:Tyrosine-protein kinase Etk/Wzc n=1 Tax=Chitinasiproducens palmae TaxID=1770053 RepID=A0A1H2PVR2_9BURK|nr:polysaccharide biosynthesis tyrosine autokinase [Chitinasiproducens palmae]SDV50556.1 tyrosine-protein kinase Etk/Wzc [Chitinasiproducens palmae]